jgi:hypothetical protein
MTLDENAAFVRRLEAVQPRSDELGIYDTLIIAIKNLVRLMPLSLVV